MYLLLELLNKTKEMNASDLHLTVGLAPTIRCNGKLIQLGIDKLSSNDLERFSREILQEKYDEYIEIGEFDTSYSVEGVGRFRINVFKEKNNDAIAIRVIALKIPTLNELNHPEVLKSIINKKRGLILVTGPTGSGKSTTLAAMINEINNTREEHIITLEDPIEYLHNHNKCIINQREIGRDSKSYNKALKAVLREDPDVILVGEMRDLETISIAITAAETGHLVFSTLHTIGAVKTIDSPLCGAPLRRGGRPGGEHHEPHYRSGDGRGQLHGDGDHPDQGGGLHCAHHQRQAGAPRHPHHQGEGDDPRQAAGQVRLHCGLGRRGLPHQRDLPFCG